MGPAKDRPFKRCSRTGPRRIALSSAAAGRPATDRPLEIDSRRAPAGELAAIQLVARRLPHGQRPGDLGYRLLDNDDHDPLRIDAVRPHGPAARAGLEVGAEIVAIDGHDVVGNNRYLYFPLVKVPARTSLRIGLATGEARTLVVAAPR